jgi:DNA-binding transcriptional regulator YiaG
MSGKEKELLHVVSARRALAGGEMRSLRKSLGVSAAEAAHAIGVSRQTVLNWESGRSSPTRTHLLRYAKLLAGLRDAS